MSSKIRCWLCQNPQNPTIQACGCRYNIQWSCPACIDHYMVCARRSGCLQCKQRYILTEVPLDIAHRMIHNKVATGSMVRKRTRDDHQKALAGEKAIREMVQKLIEENEKEKEFCIVCYDDATDPIRTCKCKGMMGSMCRACLKNYVNHTRETHCKKCKGRYAIQPTVRPQETKIRVLPVLVRGNGQGFPTVEFLDVPVSTGRRITVNIEGQDSQVFDIPTGERGEIRFRRQTENPV